MNDVHAQFFRILSFRKSSCGDLQSRLKVRKVLGVGDTAGSICSSKISQILGQSDHLLFQLPSQLAAWLVLSTMSFSCLSAMVTEETCRCVNEKKIEVISFLNRVSSGQRVYAFSCLAITNRRSIWRHPTPVRISFIAVVAFILVFAVLAIILGLTLRSGNKSSLQLVLISLTLFHVLSFLSRLSLDRQREKHIAVSLVSLPAFSCSLAFHFKSDQVQSATRRHRSLVMPMHQHAFLSVDQSNRLVVVSIQQTESLSEFHHVISIIARRRQWPRARFVLDA